MATPLGVVEAPAVLVAVAQRLLADSGAGGVATLVGSRVFRDAAPGGTVAPYVLVSWLSAQALTTANGIHVSSDILLLVKIVDTGMDRSRVAAIEKRVMLQLDQYERVTVNGVYITKLRFQEAAPQPDAYDTSGVRYQYSNLIYHTEAQAA